MEENGRCRAHCARRQDAMRGDARRNAPFRSFRSVRFSSTQLFSFTSNQSLRKGIQGGTNPTCRRCTLAQFCTVDNYLFSHTVTFVSRCTKCTLLGVGEAQVVRRGKRAIAFSVNSTLVCIKIAGRTSSTKSEFKSQNIFQAKRCVNSACRVRRADVTSIFTRQRNFQLSEIRRVGGLVSPHFETDPINFRLK
jgi:hypothetical protein